MLNRPTAAGRAAIRPGAHPHAHTHRKRQGVQRQGEGRKTGGRSAHKHASPRGLTRLSAHLGTAFQPQRTETPHSRHRIGVSTAIQSTCHYLRRLGIGKRPPAGGYRACGSSHRPPSLSPRKISRGGLCPASSVVSAEPVLLACWLPGDFAPLVHEFLAVAVSC